MRRGLRLGAVLTVVLVALTGFKGRGHSHGHGGGGGGCSSSASHHSGSGYGSSSGSGSGSGGYSDSDDYSSSTGSSSGGSRYRDYNDDDYGDSASSSGSSGGSASSDEPEATVVTCADKDKGENPAATVKVRNRSGSADTYMVDMEFRDKNGAVVTSGSANVPVPARETRTVRVPLDDPSPSGTVVTCEVVSVF
ncbi:hypothetical protein ABZU86_00970 [Streptomyces sp. NPDC005271]|uniref:hypothetical protein n=1 Tax=unclassified Streptomyces TaxID=2593676 RepID=UPI0033BB85D5